MSIASSQHKWEAVCSRFKCNTTETSSCNLQLNAWTHRRVLWTLRFLWEKIGKDCMGKILLGILHGTTDFVKMPSLLPKIFWIRNTNRFFLYLESSGMSWEHCWSVISIIPFLQHPRRPLTLPFPLQTRPRSMGCPCNREPNVKLSVGKKKDDIGSISPVYSRWAFWFDCTCCCWYQRECWLLNLVHFFSECPGPCT